MNIIEWRAQTLSLLEAWRIATRMQSKIIGGIKLPISSEILLVLSGPEVGVDEVSSMIREIVFRYMIKIPSFRKAVLNTAYPNILDCIDNQEWWPLVDRVISIENYLQDLLEYPCLDAGWGIHKFLEYVIQHSKKHSMGLLRDSFHKPVLL